MGLSCHFFSFSIQIPKKPLLFRNLFIPMPKVLLLTLPETIFLFENLNSDTQSKRNTFYCQFFNVIVDFGIMKPMNCFPAVAFWFQDFFVFFLGYVEVFELCCIDFISPCLFKQLFIQDLVHQQQSKRTEKKKNDSISLSFLELLAF